MKKGFKTVIAALSVFVFFIIATALRFAANALNSVLSADMFGLAVLFVFMLGYAFFIFYGYSLTVFALNEKKYLKALLFAASAAVGAIASNVALNGFYGTKTSIVPIVAFAAMSYLIPFTLSFIMKNRAVMFTVTGIALVFLNILLLNAISPEAATSLGAAFPNLRINSELGDNNGVLSYLLYVVVFGVEYLALRKSYKKIC
ncbi:MAG: hypothetical protein IJD95_02345 [Clostridia bacterium]|nr:hypothetical protein [Clostridia bacterium]